MKCYNYYPNYISDEKNYYFNKLLNEINFKQDYIFINNLKIKESRLTSWQTETDIDCCYGGKKMKASPFSPTVKKIKELIEKDKNIKLDSVLINYYKDGKHHINYHSDEYDIHKNNDIFVVSFGGIRKFIIREKKNHSNRDTFLLSNGDLFHMYDKCQELYDHSIRRNLKDNITSRISLSFRNLTS